MAKNSPTRSPLSGNPVYQQLQVQLAQSESEVAALKTRVAAYEARYARLKAAANNVPKIEADLQQLNRDYEVNRQNYEKLIARRESAQMSSDMDASAGLVEFRVIDPPRVSPRPVAPNRQLLVTMVFLGGLAGGIGVAFLMGQIRPTFSDRKALRDISGLPILGTVTMIWTDGQVRQRRRKLTWFIAASAGPDLRVRRRSGLLRRALVHRLGDPSEPHRTRDQAHGRSPRRAARRSGVRARAGRRRGGARRAVRRRRGAAPAAGRGRVFARAAAARRPGRARAGVRRRLGDAGRRRSAGRPTRSVRRSAARRSRSICSVFARAA